MGWRNLFSSCAVCCVSFWFWREKGFGSILVQIRIYYLEYNTVVVVRESFITTGKIVLVVCLAGCAVVSDFGSGDYDRKKKF